MDICFHLLSDKTEKCDPVVPHKSMETVNGMFPGPRVVAREGDRLVVKVVNHVPNNISIHRYELISVYTDHVLLLYMIVSFTKFLSYGTVFID
jgi:hypothetical protein